MQEFREASYTAVGVFWGGFLLVTNVLTLHYEAVRAALVQLHKTVTSCPSWFPPPPQKSLTSLTSIRRYNPIQNKRLIRMKHSRTCYM